MIGSFSKKIARQVAVGVSHAATFLISVSNSIPCSLLLIISIYVLGLRGVRSNPSNPPPPYGPDDYNKRISFVVFSRVSSCFPTVVLAISRLTLVYSIRQVVLKLDNSIYCYTP